MSFVTTGRYFLMESLAVLMAFTPESILWASTETVQMTSSNITATKRGSMTTVLIFLPAVTQSCLAPLTIVDKFLFIVVKIKLINKVM